MKNNRYSLNRSKQKLRETSSRRQGQDKGINIQIFNITSRNKMRSTSKRDKSVNFQQFFQIQSGDRMKRGNSVFQRKNKQKDEMNLSCYGPIIPNYNVKKNSSKKLKAESSSRALTSEMNRSTFSKGDIKDQQIGVEELHYQMVKFQQKCKKAFTKK